MDQTTAKYSFPTALPRQATGQTSVSTFYIKASDAGMVSMAMNMVESFLLQITRDEEAYTVSNQSDILDTMDDVNNTMTLLLGGHCRYLSAGWEASEL